MRIGETIILVMGIISFSSLPIMGPTDTFGNRINARDLLRAFYSATKKAKIDDLRWHDATRHTFATRLVQNGVDIYTAQKLGRWKNISQVMRYAHHYLESLRAGIEVSDKARKKVSTILAQSDGKRAVSSV